MADWVVWPIFVVQGIAFLLLFLSENTVFLKMKIRIIVLILLFLICVVMAVSLYHDSTDYLKLYF